jgi:hypothetical protein
MPAIEGRPEWVKSSLSFGNGNCIEVANLFSGDVGVRNGGDHTGVVLRCAPDERSAFICVHNKEFECAGRKGLQCSQAPRGLPRETRGMS